MASLTTLLFTAMFGKKVGQDEFGNRYYCTKFFSKQVGRYGKERRWVIFNGKAEPSKIPPLWHGWMHYTLDTIPTGKEASADWQKPHLPNLTGTEFSYLPSGHTDSGGKRDKATGDYTPWQP